MSIDKVEQSNSYIKQYQQQLSQKSVAAAPALIKSKSDTVELSNKNNPEKPNYLKWGIFAIGAAAIAYGIYYLSKGRVKTTGNQQNIPEPVNLKKFFNKENNLVSGVKLEKGKALMSDGSGFTGILKATRPDGKALEIIYKDGLMQESTVEGLFRKKYSRFRFEGDLNDSVGILREDLTNGKYRTTLLDFHENGKLKMIKTSPEHNKTERLLDYQDYNKQTHDFIAFDETGKKFAEGKNKFAKFYDKDGNLIRTIEPRESSSDVISDGFIEKTYDAQGNLVKEITGFEYNNNLVSSGTTMQTKGLIKYPDGSYYRTAGTTLYVNKKELPYSFNREMFVKTGENNLSYLVIKPTNNYEICINPTTGTFDEFLNGKSFKDAKIEPTNLEEIKKHLSACKEGCDILLKEKFIDSPIMQDINILETLQKALSRLNA